jgi:DNA replicative helicase MCM subunit Mcm2 (Cdc46/Mcm family)
LNKKNGFPVFATVVEANYVEKKQDLFAAYKLTDEDKADIQRLSKDPRIGQRVQILFNSFNFSLINLTLPHLLQLRLTLI